MPLEAEEGGRKAARDATREEEAADSQSVTGTLPALGGFDYEGSRLWNPAAFRIWEWPSDDRQQRNSPLTVRN